MACLRKAQTMASDPQTLKEGALAKIAEFQRLRYPISVLNKACVFLAANTGEVTWLLGYGSGIHYSDATERSKGR